MTDKKYDIDWEEEAKKPYSPEARRREFEEKQQYEMSITPREKRISEELIKLRRSNVNKNWIIFLLFTTLFLFIAAQNGWLLGVCEEPISQFTTC